MKSICNIRECTACELCRYKCPKQCISIQRVKGLRYATIDQSRCVSCGMCESVCPNIQMVKTNEPLKAFAAWNKDCDDRHSSASGGIAAALYKWAKKNDYIFLGVVLDKRFEAHFKIGHTDKDISLFQNSKYTYSYMDFEENWGRCLEKIKNGKKVLFVGLPCQVAAVIKLFDTLKIDREQLLAVDLVCHGTPQPEYLKEHIKSIEELKGKKYEKCFFRDPSFGTQNYYYTLYDNCHEKPSYASRVLGTDNYQIGYHRALIYRDCCYTCKYAKKSRVGDITLSDYLGIGKLKPLYDGEKNKLSCMMGNTKLGLSIIQQLADNFINVTERPIEEPTSSDPQFQHPSIDSWVRRNFLREYEISHDFALAANKAFKQIRIKNMIKIALRYEYLRKAIRKVKRLISVRKR